MPDLRYDPFLAISTAIAITNELRSIPSNSPYYDRLLEVPVKESPSSLSIKVRSAITAAITSAGATSITVANGSWFAINDVITISNEKMLVTNVAGNTLTVTRGYASTTATTHLINTPVFGPAWEEVATTPASRQFWPDYSATVSGDATWNTGMIAFNAADAGKTIAVSYKGMGVLVDAERAEAQPGEVAFFPFSTAPPGWLKANGAAVSRAVYYRLFAEIGTIAGAGNGYSTFNIPDLRGYFLRCWDDGRGIDSGRTMGSVQADDNKSHTHEYYGRHPGSTANMVLGGLSDGAQNSTHATSASGGSESRPKNVALLACIKY